MIREIGRLVARPATYSRGLHLCLPLAFAAVWIFIDDDRPYMLALFVVPVGLVPAMRLAEGIQARLFLTPGEETRTAEPSIGAASSASWSDRWRTVLWLEVRLALSAVLCAVCVPMIMLCADLVGAAVGAAPSGDALLKVEQSQWWYALLIPLPVVVILATLIGLGSLVTVLARWLLGPSAADRMRALEERTDLLLEHTRLARELHDSIGHALTAAVLQAGAARAAGDPEFTARALRAIEETGRDALDDLDRVLLVLRDSTGPGDRPTLADAHRLVESARSAGAEVDVSVTGALDHVPGPLSREGYRIVQESLTNALRHAGPGPVLVRAQVDAERLELEVTSALPVGVSPTDRGSGLRGIRERAELLGGRAVTGPADGVWLVHVTLPFDGTR
ncbi:sensor histidine kinase [Rhodococcus artemisiae]|uniref:histidine kinase n=1 Tax=Rhodococcus artemisiae TaxID=714159 RepID=A0ABU7L4F4_9NOCA|nr:histidine kinase [Rhodococcus artemisiae]MEE2056426.1 histidine kinase [Rhodococcus artemisiae]